MLVKVQIEEDLKAKALNTQGLAASHKSRRRSVDADGSSTYGSPGVEGRGRSNSHSNLGDEPNSLFDSFVNERLAA